MAFGNGYISSIIKCIYSHVLHLFNVYLFIIVTVRGYMYNNYCFCVIIVRFDCNVVCGSMSFILFFRSTIACTSCFRYDTIISCLTSFKYKKLPISVFSLSNKYKYIKNNLLRIHFSDFF